MGLCFVKDNNTIFGTEGHGKGGEDSRGKDGWNILKFSFEVKKSESVWGDFGECLQMYVSGKRKTNNCFNF